MACLCGLFIPGDQCFWLSAVFPLPCSFTAVKKRAIGSRRRELPYIGMMCQGIKAAGLPAFLKMLMQAERGLLEEVGLHSNAANPAN